MADEKPPYKLVIKFTSARPDAIGDALAQLRELASEFDQTGEGTAQVTFESFRQRDLTELSDAFEDWLFRHMIGIGCEMSLKRPGLRPEMLATLRARHGTPMDAAGWGVPPETDEETIDEPTIDGTPVEEPPPTGDGTFDPADVIMIGPPAYLQLPPPQGEALLLVDNEE